VVFIAPVTELIPKNTLSNEDVVVLIEPVTEDILKLVNSCEPVCICKDEVACCNLSTVFESILVTNTLL
jgi:hypothetical protein